MSASEMGAKRARAYLSYTSLKILATMTFAQFCAIGRLDAQQHYKQKKAQDDYALVWFQIGQQFLTLFKPDDNDQFVVEQEIENALRLLSNAQTAIEKLLTWRRENSILHRHFAEALREVEDAQCDIQDVISYLNHS